MGSLFDISSTSQEYEENINFAFKRLQHSHRNKVIFSCLNIKSIRNKFGDLGKVVDEN